MTDQTSRRVRFAYVTLLLVLTVFAVAESALGAGRTAARRAEGLTACGTESQPCTLEPVAVIAAPVEARSESFAACGTAENPCVLAPVAVKAERGMARLATTGRVEQVPVMGKS